MYDLNKFSRIRMIFVVFMVIMNLTSISSDEDEPKEGNKLVITPKLYSNIFVRRREEQKMFVKNLVKSDNYERKYKMLEIAFNKILEIVKEQNMTLHQSEYSTKSGFPQEEKLRDAVTLIMENVCLAGEIILHIPEISYRLLRNHNNWKNILNWGMDFVNDFGHIIDDNTAKMLELFRQEVNESDRSKDFINPYYPPKRTKLQKKEKKPRKKIKKGPQLTKVEL